MIEFIPDDIIIEAIIDKNLEDFVLVTAMLNIESNPALPVFIKCFPPLPRWIEDIQKGRFRETRR